MLQHRFRQVWRWSLLSSILLSLFWAIYYVVNGSVPVVSTFKLFNGDILSLPIKLSRWWDMLMVPCQLMMLVLIFSLNFDKKFFSKIRIAVHSRGLFDGLEYTLVFGMLAGLIMILAWQINCWWLLILNIITAFFVLWHFGVNICFHGGMSRIEAMYSLFGLLVCSAVFAISASLAVVAVKGVIIGIIFGLPLGFITFWLTVILMIIFALILAIRDAGLGNRLKIIKDQLWYDVRVGIKPWAKFVAWLADS